MEAKDSQDSQLMEKIIIFLVILVGAILTYNQFQYAKLSSNSMLNVLSFLLIAGLIGLMAFLFLKKETSHGVHQSHGVHHFHKTPLSLQEKLSWGMVAFVGVLILFNQFQISQVSALASGKSPTTVGSLIKSVSDPVKFMGSGKSSIVIGPQLNPDGRTTKLVEWPTISETIPPKSTGNSAQDAIATVVPTGTPFYVLSGPGSEKIQGVTFDDPIASQKIWASLLGSRRFGTANAIELTPEEQERWDKMVSIYTCDYCCGGPSSVTTINRCGCAHSYAWQGMAKFFIRYYPEYTNEQVMGEMTKWKGLWYPKGMVEDYLVYTGQQPASILTHGGSVGIKQQFLQQGSQPQETQASVSELDQLQGMVGGC